MHVYSRARRLAADGTDDHSSRDNNHHHNKTTTDEASKDSSAQHSRAADLWNMIAQEDEQRPSSPRVCPPSPSSDATAFGACSDVRSDPLSSDGSDWALADEFQPLDSEPSSSLSDDLDPARAADRTTLVASDLVKDSGMAIESASQDTALPDQSRRIGVPSSHGYRLGDLFASPRIMLSNDILSGRGRMLPLSSASARVVKAKSRQLVARKQPVQQMLDAGQKLECKTCGMIMAAHDEQAHLKHHEELQMRKEGLVPRSHRWESTDLATDARTSGMLVEVRKSDLFFDTVVLPLMSADLGLLSVEEASQLRKFLFITRDTPQRAVGCVMLEEFNPTTMTIISPSNSSGPAASASSTSASTKPAAKVVLGVNRIWVSKAFRKFHIATRLLDFARAHYYTVGTVEKANIAFTPLTDNGRAFALAYLQETNAPPVEYHHTS
ncbi:hypothetical protein CAOG_03567 [Capsaspora owczarzaki ATCC 30864]|uniref:N-acetyltransferase ESCO acetyl-transferase domain-containing protein n=1 Tax=Capsaspora owczarzaki (strain ATCC 30864) TaxID=595528 RepID=A0A0D2VQ28_CAPO3|nr:hypothetical protein CAOG_03567 [Capsaspora owczarzaki ATCC 30864]KJE92647.1 hypothetical protein CAOG_003567 [Capsaspora owczarzaki ATCC 30864]|eukprot:XP_004363295.1 hypothetical protein CAOG_03567 [Capsaspora owczarzaki ATCC 30864]